MNISIVIEKIGNGFIAEVRAFGFPGLAEGAREVWYADTLLGARGHVDKALGRLITLDSRPKPDNAA